MARLPRARIRTLLSRADAANTPQERGALLEQAIRELFGCLPGVELLQHNIRNVANTEEIDIFFWNQRLTSGLYFLETPFLVECKNWGSTVPGHEVVYFANSMQNRCCKDGVLVASNGISGDPGTLTEAHYEIAMALTRGRRILVITRDEIENLRSGRELMNLLKLKIVDLTIHGTKVH